MTFQRHQVKDKFVKLTTECKHLINNCLKLDWSPEQICGWFNASNIIQLHHESVYRYLLKDKANGGLLYQTLDIKVNLTVSVMAIPIIVKRIDIYVYRLVFGHWEILLLVKLTKVQL